VYVLADTEVNWTWLGLLHRMFTNRLLRFPTSTHFTHPDFRKLSSPFWAQTLIVLT